MSRDLNYKSVKPIFSHPASINHDFLDVQTKIECGPLAHNHEPVELGKEVHGPQAVAVEAVTGRLVSPVNTSSFKLQDSLPLRANHLSSSAYAFAAAVPITQRDSYLTQTQSKYPG